MSFARFERVMRVLTPVATRDDEPLREVLPAWPTWGEFKECVAAVRQLRDYSKRVVQHCQAMNFDTREEQWIREELEEILDRLGREA